MHMGTGLRLNQKRQLHNCNFDTLLMGNYIIRSSTDLMKCNIENIKDIFSRMKNDGWNTSCKLKWSYFFFDTNKESLNAIFEEIKERDYKLESLEKTDENDGIWKLQLSKIEAHTPETLHKRNEAMNRLAEQCNVNLYDGWDVEKILEM